MFRQGLARKASSVGPLSFFPLPPTTNNPRKLAPSPSPNPPPSPPSMTMLDPLLSKRGATTVASINRPWRFASRGDYDADKNPDGLVAFSTAENVGLSMPSMSPIRGETRQQDCRAVHRKDLHISHPVLDSRHRRPRRVCPQKCNVAPGTSRACVVAYTRIGIPLTPSRSASPARSSCIAAAHPPTATFRPPWQPISTTTCSRMSPSSPST